MILICLTTAAISSASMKLGITWVSHAVENIPNTLSAATVISAM